MSEPSHTFRRCEAEGCRRRIMAHLGYTLCLLHRGRPAYPRKTKGPKDREREKALKARRDASAGLPWVGI